MNRTSNPWNWKTRRITPAALTRAFEEKKQTEKRNPQIPMGLRVSIRSRPDADRRRRKRGTAHPHHLDAGGTQ